MDWVDDDELERIIDDEDRSATLVLLGQLADPTVIGDHRAKVVEALGAVADPRSTDRLVAIAEDLGLDAAIRHAALEVLTDSGLCPEGATRRRWWATGDLELQRRVLIEAGRTETDLIGPIARDPSHVHYRQAILGIESYFEEPEWQACKIEALSHRSPAVRQTAAEVLVWDEPVRAEPALHVAAGNDRADEVAVAAIETLQYYPSRATIRLLHELATSHEGERAFAAAESLDAIRTRCLDELLGARAYPQKRSALQDWMSSVWSILSFTPIQLNPPHRAARKYESPSREPAPPATKLIADYDDLDGPWRAKLEALRRYEWSTVPEIDRLGLASFLSEHVDPQVRGASCPALAAWQQTDTLLRLTDDEHLGVRRLAMYHLAEVPPSMEVAIAAWNLVGGGLVAGFHAAEALATYVAHAPGGTTRDQLIELALNDRRESIRWEAIGRLGTAGLAAVARLLAEPPLVTWGVHTTILAAFAQAELTPPPLDRLRDVDNLYVAEGVAWFTVQIASRVQASSQSGPASGPECFAGSRSNRETGAVLTDQQRREAAAALRQAERTRVPIPPLTETWPGIDVYDAYAIQLLQVQAKLDEGAIVQGMKVGLTSQAMQEMLGVDEPDFGHLLASMFVLDGGSVPVADFCAPRIEPEIAFVLAEQLQGPGITAADVIAATEAVVPALEIVDSRIEGWRIKLPDTVADAASSARVVLGETRVAPSDLDLAAIGVAMSKNGDVVEKATGAAVMGHPANAVAWLVNKLAELETGIEAGHVVMPGACTRAIPVVPGDTVHAEFAGLGSVSVSFT